MAQVGEFPAPRRPIIRSPKNPIDKSTIVSVYPKEIYERKHEIEPGEFRIPSGSMENPGMLVVGASSWWNYRGDAMPTLEIPVSSVSVAESVIRDSCSMFLVDIGTTMPGLFFVPGTPSSLEIKTSYKSSMQKAYDGQIEWFKRLVRAADSLWARANGNPLSISDEMRLAARSLNMNEKPWLLDFNIVEKVPCVACGELKNPAYPVCPNCKAIDKTHQLAKDLTFSNA